MGFRRIRLTTIRVPILKHVWGVKTNFCAETNMKTRDPRTAWTGDRLVRIWPIFPNFWWSWSGPRFLNLAGPGPTSFCPWIPDEDRQTMQCPRYAWCEKGKEMFGNCKNDEWFDSCKGKLYRKNIRRRFFTWVGIQETKISVHFRSLQNAQKFSLTRDHQSIYFR